MAQRSNGSPVRAVAQRKPAVSKPAGGALTAPAQKPVTVTRRDGKIVIATPEPERDWIRKVLGVRSERTAAMLYRQMMAMNLWSLPASNSEDPETDVVMAALNLFEEFRPQNTLQAMLVVQMMGVHHAAAECLAFATGNTREDGQRVPRSDLDVVDARMRQATQLMRLFTEQLDAWASLKGKRGRQKMTVRHVHVHPGGQAIVGNVNSARRRRSLPAGEGTGA